MQFVLIPTDFSANSWNALEYAVRFFEEEACTFYILHVGDLTESSMDSNSFTLPMEKISPSIKEKLNSLFKRIEGLPINKNHYFIALQEYGNFIDIIRKKVDAKNIDLIVMGTKGATGLRAAVVGSNSGDVITKVACNVLVIPENAPIKTPEKISFPTDYNIFYSHTILSPLTDVLRISKAHLHVLNIFQEHIAVTNTQYTNKAYLRDYLGEIVSENHSFYHIADTDIKSAILDFVATNNIDMLTMVAKNLNFLQQLLFDTTIEKLSFHTTIPILVLHD